MESEDLGGESAQSLICPACKTAAAFIVFSEHTICRCCGFRRHLPCVIPEIATHAKRLLVVDDALALSELVAEMLFEAGYEVSFVSNRTEAIPLLSMCPHVVLMDVEMTGVSLQEFMWVFRAKCPGSRIVLMSGSHNESIAARHGIQHFLSKPFRRDQLTDALGEVQRSATRAH